MILDTLESLFFFFAMPLLVITSNLFFSALPSLLLMPNVSYFECCCDNDEAIDDFVELFFKWLSFAVIPVLLIPFGQYSSITNWSFPVGRYPYSFWPSDSDFVRRLSDDLISNLSTFSVRSTLIFSPLITIRACDARQAPSSIPTLRRPSPRHP